MLLGRRVNCGVRAPTNQLAKRVARHRCVAIIAAAEHTATKHRLLLYLRRHTLSRTIPLSP